MGSCISKKPNVLSNSSPSCNSLTGAERKSCLSSMSHVGGPVNDYSESGAVMHENESTTKNITNECINVISKTIEKLNGEKNQTSQITTNNNNKKPLPKQCVFFSF